MKKKMTVFMAMVFIAFTYMSGNVHGGMTGEPMGMSQEVSHWIGKDVKNPAGEELGKVRDFIRDDKGRISLAVLSHGGFMGFGEKRAAVPFSALSYNEYAGHFVLHATEEQLANAPKIGDENINDQGYAEEVYRYFGQRPYWTEQGGSSADDMNKGMDKSMDRGTQTEKGMDSPMEEGSTTGSSW